MTQLDLTIPAAKAQRAITEAVHEILEERAGVWISQAQLGEEAFRRCNLTGYADTTKARRVKDACHELRVERRVLIASSERGYRLDLDRSGLRRIIAQMRSEAEVVRAYDPALADKLTPWLDLAERSADAA